MQFLTLPCGGTKNMMEVVFPGLQSGHEMLTSLPLDKIWGIVLSFFQKWIGEILFCYVDSQVACAADINRGLLSV
jgi:hypothetical protein